MTKSLQEYTQNTEQFQVAADPHIKPNNLSHQLLSPQPPSLSSIPQPQSR